MQVVNAPQLEKILTKAHEKKWVALSTDYQRLVAFADTLKDLNEKVGSEDVVVMQVLPSDALYAPLVTS